MSGASFFDFVEASFNRVVGARAITTLIPPGAVDPPYYRANLSHTVGDSLDQVRINRQRLIEQFNLPSDPVWLTQVHGTNVRTTEPSGAQADASVSADDHEVLCVLTADCLPVVLTSRDGRVRGIAHAGWRGLLAGVIEHTAATLVAQYQPGELFAWCGPCIGPHSFEVGAEVRSAFIDRYAPDAVFFKENPNQRYWADLPGLATRRLAQLGISTTVCGVDTLTDKRCFSYRRQPVTGRMATLVWYPSPLA